MPAISASLYEALQGADTIGREQALAAASWVIDGRHTHEHYRDLLRLIDDGDPRMWDMLPAEPNLSGEWADDLTPYQLALELGFEDPSGEVIDRLADAFDDAVMDAFIPEIERLLIEATR
jgi:hypothetical protein